MKGLKGKRILITAGPTWVAIDSVRVISNIATGETGILLAGKAAAQGARVTLLLGPCVAHNLTKDRQFRIIRFSFFEDLRNALIRELKNNKYDIIIHAAAVSDFKPIRKYSGKLGSGKIQSLRLVPLEKLAGLIRCLAREARLVMFKLELGVADSALIKRSIAAKGKFKADLMVANRLNPYRAFVIDGQQRQVSVRNRQELARKLISILSVNSKSAGSKVEGRK